MKCAILGLPNSGKTTLFNALTGNRAVTTAFSTGRVEPNLATVRVPDPRLEILNEIYQPQKLTHAEIQFVDIGGIKGCVERRDAISPEVLHYLGTADALLHVVRGFPDDLVPHPLNSVDPVRDVKLVDLELILSDLVIAERRLERLEKEIRKLPEPEKAKRKEERDLLVRVKDGLETESPVRDMDLTERESKLLRGFQFLSAKPTLVVLNIEESQVNSAPNLDYSHRQSVLLTLSAQLESELVELDEEDLSEFLHSLGLTQPARDRVIAATYELLGLMSFMTVGEDEVRAWTIRRGMTAPEAGGVIHSDIQRGFIRAEVVQFENLKAAGSISEARKRGVLRLEGKNYVLQDGDISHFLFNV